MRLVTDMRGLPPEFEAAKQTLLAAARDAFPVVGSFRLQVSAYVLMLLLGMVGGAWLVGLDVLQPTAQEFWRGATTALSVLSGFMVATMVFTGKIEAAKSLSITELRQVAQKVNYLLLYQVVTLANHLFTILLLLIVPFIAARYSTLGAILAVVGVGLIVASVLRSVLIPIQIIELHRFTHAALLRDKSKEIAAQAEEV